MNFNIREFKKILLNDKRLLPVNQLNIKAFDIAE